MLRVSCLAAPALARLEVRDTVLAAELVSRCGKMDDDIPGRRGVAAIVGWSVAATVSIIRVSSSHPLTEDRLARMSREDRPASRPPLLTSEEWRALKSICDNKI